MVENQQEEVRLPGAEQVDRHEDVPPKIFPLTDTGNGERLAWRYGAEFVWTQATGWLVYREGVWRRDKESLVDDAMTRTVRRITLEVDLLKGYGLSDKALDGAITEISDFARKSESNKSINAALSRAAANQAFARDYAKFNKHPELLCCGNGVFNFETGEFGEHKPEHLLTAGMNVRYDPAATCPRFEKFVSEICCGSENLTGYLRRAAGYTLTANTDECSMFILTGEAGGGKSTYVNILSGIMGEYARTADAEMLMAKKGDSGQPFEFAGTEGTRLLTAVETEPGKQFASARLKRMVGNDMIRACYKHKDSYEYRPQYKLYLACNEFPKTDASDQAMWDRLRPIPFNARFRGEATEIKDLAAKLLAEEASGILNWMLRGHSEWKAIGLAEPAEARQVAEELRENEDFLKRFLEEKTAKDDRSEKMVLCSRLYDAFKFWADQSKEGRGWSKKRFAKEMKARGYEPKNVKVGGVARYVWLGLTEETVYTADNFVPDSKDVL